MNLAKKLAFPFIIVVFSILYLFSAWVADDAYITFRTIENFHQGYGLRWNVDERVQSYTHPLWMLNLLIGKYVIDDLYFLVIVLGFSYSVLTLYLIYQLTKHHLGLFILTSLIFFSSKAVLDFSSSGLENSLSYFLIALFFYLVIQHKEHRSFYLYLSLTLSLMFLNRMDLIIPFLPLALYFFFYEPYKNHTLKRSVAAGFIGFIPVILWSAFALYYYGSFFANSVIAKTNLGLPATHLQIQGFKYLYANLVYEPVTSLFIYAVLLYSLFSKNTLNKILGIGLAFYLLYLINVGADYMYGRFLAVPFIICLFIVAKNGALLPPKFTQIAIGLALVATSYNVYQYTVKDIQKFHTSNIHFNDERAFYYRTTGLWLVLNKTNTTIANHFSETPILFEDADQKVLALYTMGFNGYIVSKIFPEKHIVDKLALTDAFLAAHPMSYGYWRVGHFNRSIGTDYMDSIKAKRNLLRLAEDRYVLDQVWLLSRAPLNDPKRLQAIIDWHIGKTFKVAHLAFKQYPHHLLMNPQAKEYGNLWVPQP